MWWSLEGEVVGCRPSNEMEREARGMNGRSVGPSHDPGMECEPREVTDKRYRTLDRSQGIDDGFQQGIGGVTEPFRTHCVRASPQVPLLGSGEV